MTTTGDSSSPVAEGGAPVRTPGDTGQQPLPDSTDSDSTDSDSTGEAAAAADTEGNDIAAVRRQAAGYRTKLRAAETEIGALRAQVETLQRAQAEQVIAGHGIQPAAVWAAGATLAELCDADGRPDPGRIAAAVDKARNDFGIPARTRRPPNLDGLSSGSTGNGMPLKTTWHGALNSPND